MATRAQTIAIRLMVKDPKGFTNIIDVATKADLPANPVNQTAYFITSESVYYAYDGAEWLALDLRISDTFIGDKIDIYTDMNKAASKVIRSIIIDVGMSLGNIQSHGNGSENLQYRTLKDVYDFYKEVEQSFLEDYNESSGASTGCYISTMEPLVGGMA